MKDTPCTVVYQTPVGEGYFRIGLSTRWSGFVPGQFGMLEVPREEGAILRRPFSFARQDGEVTEILYKVVGKGTRALQKVEVGQSLKLLGPLGHGFSRAEKSGDRIGIAGGYGIAPFLELARQMKSRGEQLQLFYGARTSKDLIYIQELKELNVKLHLSTVDGSEGHRGWVTELLEKTYLEHSPAMAWSCGPMGLLKAVKAWAHSRKIPCEVSVEETMGCGTGVCLGCVVQNREGHFIRACIEGPVFNGEAIQF